MPTTIQHIADDVGVSKQAVSYALNGKTHQVSSATRQRILASAKRLNYQPNFRARSFARKRSQIVGLVYGRPADYLERSQAVAHLVERLADLDHELLLIPARGPVDQWRHKLSDGRVDGCLITHPMPEGLDQFVAEHRVPAVLMNLRSDQDVPQVTFDDAHGMHLAIDHLLALGHRRIAYYCAPKVHGRHYSNTERRDVFLHAMDQAGLAAGAWVVEDVQPEPFARSLADTPAPKRPTAVVVYNRTDSERLIPPLRALGLRCPADLSLVTFGERETRTPEITHFSQVDLPTDQMIDHCVRLLMPQISSDHHIDSAADAPPLRGELRPGMTSGPPSSQS
jgi:LacI family transcriptional regulator